MLEKEDFQLFDNSLRQEKGEIIKHWTYLIGITDSHIGPGTYIIRLQIKCLRDKLCQLIHSADKAKINQSKHATILAECINYTICDKDKASCSRPNEVWFHMVARKEHRLQ